MATWTRAITECSVCGVDTHHIWRAGFDTRYESCPKCGSTRLTGDADAESQPCRCGAINCEATGAFLKAFDSGKIIL